MVLYRAALPGMMPPANAPQGLEFRALAAEDFRRGAIFKEKNRAPQFERMLNAGHRCYGFVTAQGEAASYLWLSSPRYATPAALFELRLSCRIAPGTVYIWDCRVHPDFRRRGLYRDGLKRVMALGQLDGLTAAVIASEAGNDASNAAIMAAGFVADYSMTILRFLGTFYLVAARGRIFVRGPGGVVDI
jgi:ribosomal protein S18 acetylase RimI-like enzyme